MNIIKNSNFTEYRNCRERAEKIKYIVIHYTGNSGSTAADNVAYFNNGNRSASAHYFVNFDGSVREYCDPAKWYAWHCGGPLESSHHPYYGKCTNGNSIGIEICTKQNGSIWEFTAKAVNAAIELTKYLIQKFGVSADNVIRHYDVTGKSCPRVPGWGAVGGSSEWNKFKKSIGSGTASTATTSSTEKKFYRVRKTWADSASQIGAYLILDNAIAEANNAGAKYAVFDWKGKEIYRYSEGSGTKTKELQFYYPGYKKTNDGDYQSHGAGCVWHDQNGCCIIFDAYWKGSPACEKLIQYLVDNKLTHIDYAVLSHAHGDHGGGFFEIFEDKRFKVDVFVCYDPASLKLAGSGSENARSARDDKAYLQKLIDKANAKGAKVLFVKTGDKIDCGEISFEVCRNQPSAWSEYDTGEAWAYLNDGSINLYERACHVLLCGDGGGKKASQYFDGDIDVAESEHHGNGDGKSKVDEVKSHGCKLAIECNNEKNGPGSCGWTRYGAGRFRDAGIPVWMLNDDIKGVIKGGKMTVSQGSKKMTFDVPFGKIFYRVRKTWADASSQIGAYTVLANAKECVDKNPGYKVFDETGKQVYPATKSATTATTVKKPQTDQEKFLATIGPMAKADMAKSGICAAITIAQAILESGWGKSELAKNANNLFGMKKSLSGNTWPNSAWDGKSVYSKQTKEVYASGHATVQADFRAYKTLQDSVNDHSAYLAGARNGSSLRYKGLVGCADYKKSAQIIKAGGYATAPDYVGKLCRIVEEYDLTRYNTTYIAPKASAVVKTPYTVKVNTQIPILKTPAGTKVKTCPKGIYTIVGEKNGYGKLKSGAGWIQLSKVTKM